MPSSHSHVRVCCTQSVGLPALCDSSLVAFDCLELAAYAAPWYPSFLSASARSLCFSLVSRGPQWKLRLPMMMHNAAVAHGRGAAAAAGGTRHTAWGTANAATSGGSTSADCCVGRPLCWRHECARGAPRCRAPGPAPSHRKAGSQRDTPVECRPRRAGQGAFFSPALRRRGAPWRNISPFRWCSGSGSGGYHNQVDCSRPASANCPCIAFQN